MSNDIQQLLKSNTELTEEIHKVLLAKESG